MSPEIGTKPVNSSILHPSRKNPRIYYSTHKSKQQYKVMEINPKQIRVYGEIQKKQIRCQLIHEKNIFFFATLLKFSILVLVYNLTLWFPFPL